MKLEDALLLTDPEAVADQIFERKKCHQQMVGRLYPNLLRMEIGQLVARFDEVGGKDLANALRARSQEPDGGES